MRIVRLAAATALVIAPLATGSTGAAAAAGDVAAHVDEIERALTPPVIIEGRVQTPLTIRQLMQAKGVPALSIAFIDDGRISWVRAYGEADVAAHRAATPATLFQAGSISKPVAATAAMALVQAGSLKLDQPVNEVLRSWKIPDNELTRKSPVTLRMLLTHTGGLSVHGFEGYERGTVVPTLIQVLDGKPPANSDPIRVDLAPGTQWRYSGGGYTVAQLLMTEVSGQPFPELLRARVLQPFGMTASTYAQPLPDSELGWAAVGYRTGTKPIVGGRNTYPEMAAAGLWTTPSDVARWVIGIEDAESGRANPVLSQATAKLMLTPGKGNWGLGLEVRSEGRDRVFTHGGANEGFRNEMYGFPGRRQGVVVMTNSDSGQAVMGPLLHAVAKSYGWPGFETRVIKPVAVKPGDLAPLLGDYSVGGTVVSVRIGPDGKSLVMTPPGSEVYELIPQGGDSFVDAQEAMPATFSRDSAGRVTGLEVGGVTLARLAKP